jgi:hypothetical protein
MLTAPDDLQLLHARRFSFLLAEVVAAGLLLDEGAYALAQNGDARKAVVASRYARQRLVPTRARGILDDDRTAIDLFEPLVRYGTV